MVERPRELGDFKKARVNGGTDNHSLKDFSQVSPLPLTDPHNMVIKPFVLLGLAAEYDLDVGCERHCGRPSDVYDTDRRTKLTALETITVDFTQQTKKSLFEPPFMTLRGNYTYALHLWLVGKPVVDFIFIVMHGPFFAISYG